MHFIGLLALKIGLDLTYAPKPILLSLLIAIGAVGLGLQIVRTRTSRLRIGSAGVTVGLGIAAMHYVGMSGLRFDGSIAYVPSLWGLSLLIGMAAATVALWLSLTLRKTWHRALAALVMGGAISGMHYTGMAGTVFLVDPLAQVEPGLPSGPLIVGVVLSALAIILCALVLVAADRRLLASAEREADALRQSNARLAQMNAELELGRQQFGAVMSNLVQGLCLFDGEERLLVCNRRYIEIYDLPPENVLIGLSLSEILNYREAAGSQPVMSRAEFLAMRTAAASTTGAMPTRNVVPLTNGRVIAVSYQAMVGGGWVASHEDITELHLAERQLAQAQKMEAIGNLTGGMAHDFNNLLTVINLNLESLLDGARDDPVVQDMANRALRASLRGADLIAQLLAFARRQPLAPQRIGVNRWISSIANLLEHTLGKDIRIQLNLGTDIWPVNADATRLETAIANLATNARDAMPMGGLVTITTSNVTLSESAAADRPEVKTGDYVMIEVTDTGSGMPPEVAARIFEPFFTTKEEGRGTGLGLSMVFGFIRQSGGHITLDSAPGRGTTFRLHLPRAEGTAADTCLPSMSAATTGGNETILLVEDNDGGRLVTVSLLEQLGYGVVAARLASEALEILQSDRVLHLLISDMAMSGGIDGFQLVEKAQAMRPNLKALLASGSTERHEPAANGRAGEVRVLAKPYRANELGRVIRDVLDAKASVILLMSHTGNVIH